MNALENDKWFKDIYLKSGYFGVIKAGYSDDGHSNHIYDVDQQNTPLPQQDGDVVLLMTGGMDPIHEGHIGAMNYAKKQIEKTGAKVAACYIAPDHDQYLLSKRPDAKPAQQRVQYATSFAAPHNIIIDPWPSTIAKTNLNYVSVIDRLEQYLQHHCNKKYRIVYVYGQDNEGFGEVLKNNGICVPRDGSGSGSNVSSSKLRDGYERYIVRDDVWNNLLPTWKRLVGSQEACTKFSVGLSKIIENYCPQIFVETQHVNMATPPHVYEYPIITLDKNTPIHNHVVGRLDISRVFAANNDQQKPLYISASPGALNIDQQINSWGLDKGSKIILHDDDISSGYTMGEISKIVENHGYEIVKYIASATKETCFDIVDARDFCYYTTNSGLVVENENGTIERYLYHDKKVNLTTRANISQDQHAAFRNDIETLNTQLHTELTQLGKTNQVTK